MSPEEIAQQRLRSSRISGPAADGAAAVVHWLGAMQSQEYGVAKSVGQRGTGLTDAALDRALADGTILRTHLLRPTWHFVLPADIRWMTELTGPRVQAQNAYWYRKFGLDDAVLRHSSRLLVAALAGGTALTSQEVATILPGTGSSPTACASATSSCGPSSTSSSAAERRRAGSRPTRCSRSARHRPGRSLVTRPWQS